MVKSLLDRTALALFKTVPTIIFFPQDYPAEWLLNQRLALNEQYLLEAFFSLNTTWDRAFG